MTPAVMLRRTLLRLGVPGVVAVGVLCALPVIHLSAIRPVQARLEALQAELGELGQRSTRAADAARRGGPDPARDLADLYHTLPPVEATPHWLEQLFAAAQAQGLSLDHGQYQAAPDKAGRLVRLQLVLPVSGPYPNIRRFLVAVATDIPGLSLEHVRFERQQIDAAEVEARITFVLHLVQPS